jgi:cysteine desulfurase
MTVPPIYLDYNATTPVDPAVAELIGEQLKLNFGNPSSTHVYGQTAHAALDEARAQVAKAIGSTSDEIVFTSGGTEASNHAIKGLVFAKLQAKSEGATPHVIISSVEHPATIKPCEFLNKHLSCQITTVPVDRHGMIDPDDVRKAIKPNTCLVSIMHANNEVGAIQPIQAVADIAHGRGIPVHTDAAQSLGKIRVNVDELGVDLLSIAGHKLYAPKGVGALFVRRGIQLEPFMHGAGHEGGRRAGTENTPYLAGLGKACVLATEKLQESLNRLQKLRDLLWNLLQKGLGDHVVLNGHPIKRLPNTLNVNFIGQVGADFLRAIPEIAASTGSACHEGQVHLSPVLRAMGVSAEVGKGAVRLSVGRFTTEEEINRAAKLLIAQAKK